MKFDISILALLLGTVFNMGLGALWYSPTLFAKAWMKEAGITEEDVNNPEGMGAVYGLTGLSALLTSFVIGFLVLNLGLETFVDGLIFAVLLWAGTNIPGIIKNWGFEGRTIKLGIINHGYDLVVYLVVTLLYVFL